MNRRSTRNQGFIKSLQIRKCFLTFHNFFARHKRSKSSPLVNIFLRVAACQRADVKSRVHVGLINLRTDGFTLAFTVHAFSQEIAQPRVMATIYNFPEIQRLVHLTLLAFDVRDRVSPRPLLSEMIIIMLFNRRVVASPTENCNTDIRRIMLMAESIRPSLSLDRYDLRNFRGGSLRRHGRLRGK